MVRLQFSALAAAAIPAALCAQAPTFQNPVDPLLAPALPGSWTYAQIGGGSEASFVDGSGRSQLTIRCTRASRQISIIRPAAAAAAAIQLWTSSAARQLPASFDVTTSQVRAELSVSDRLLDALAFSRGRFAVGVSGAAPLVVPNWPEPTRAIEDCRN